jgi:hypothetical protein
MGRLLLTGVDERIIDKDLPLLNRIEQSYFYIHTAAAMNHRYARFWMALFTENGLIPS